jgi:DNA-binding MarR family transcriptional regulator
VLTEAGRERLELAGRTHVTQIREIFVERFTEDELETLVDLLGRLPGASGPAACEP